ncbi:MAG: NTP transferase domain-containing protein [Candidatus Wildermuthbacteria bacterium]|nr:NTP transferase domain-containing protein [Candidatus Wildermuthbacteria bacterium]
MRRERLTITLREDILKKVDRAINKTSIRNRSHAIEYLLEKSLSSSTNKALILAGGKGAQLKPLTEKTPKPLLPIGKKPLLQYQIELLKRCNVQDILILVGYLGDKIQEYFGDGSKFGVSIRYIRQPQKEIGTAYALSLAKEALGNTPFFVLYGDVLINIDLDDLCSYHAGKGSVATMALTSIKSPSFYGVAHVRGEKIVEFEEKPRQDISHVISAGVFCFAPEIFDYIKGSENLHLEKDVFPQLAKEGKLGGYSFEGQWFDIGNKETYEKAVKEWERK